MRRETRCTALKSIHRRSRQCATGFSRFWIDELCVVDPSETAQAGAYRRSGRSRQFFPPDKCKSLKRDGDYGNLADCSDKSARVGDKAFGAMVEARTEGVGATVSR